MTEIAIKHATAMPPPLRLYAPEVPIAIEQVILKALQKNPHDRFPTIVAFAQALEQAGNLLSQPFAGGGNLVPSNGPSTNQIKISHQYQSQAPTPNSSTQGYANLSSNPQVSQTGAQPFAFALSRLSYDPAYQVPSSPAQNGGSLPLHQSTRHILHLKYILPFKLDNLLKCKRRDVYLAVWPLLPSQ